GFPLQNEEPRRGSTSSRETASVDHGAGRLQASSRRTLLVTRRSARTGGSHSAATSRCQRRLSEYQCGRYSAQVSSFASADRGIHTWSDDDATTDPKKRRHRYALAGPRIARLSACLTLPTNRSPAPYQGGALGVPSGEVFG